MEKKSIEVPCLTRDDFSRLLPPNLVYPGLSDLFGHYSRIYLKQVISKMNSYTWFRFVEAESKSLILKKMATRVLYKMLRRDDIANICAGNENGMILGKRAVGITSKGVNYKSINEDGIGIYDLGGDEITLVACDGVGDCLVGEVASFVILNEFRRHPNRKPSEIFASSVEKLTQLGKDLVKEIPEFLTFPNEVSQAAVTAVQIKGDACTISQVGDVIFYHIRENALQLLDQNGRWLDVERLSRMFADEHYLAQRHIISNAVGRNYDPHWSPTNLTLKKGDLIILASDGLETLHPKDVQEMANKEKDLSVLLKSFYDRVIEANLRWNTVGSPIYTKPDNVSIVLYRH